MTGPEHIAWSQRRALEYLAVGDTANAVTSMMSDLRKHPDTEHLATGLAALAIGAALSGPDEVRRFIMGFSTNAKTT